MTRPPPAPGPGEARYDPELYELTHAGNPGDREFYLRACAGAQAVLELGCGAGRIALALVEAGLRVVALDDHPGMIARLARRAAALRKAQAARLCWRCEDMRRFELGQRFDRVIIPYNGLFCLLDDQAVRDCLRSVRRHLAPAGRLIFDAYRVFTPDPDWEEDDAPELVMVLTDGRVQIEVFERSRWDQPGQRLDAFYRYRFHGAGPARPDEEYCIPQRYLLPDQIERLLVEAGFGSIRWWGDFAGGSFDDQSETMIIQAGSAG